MPSEADILASLRAKNAERQRRYRERHKGTDAYRASNTERQRRYRERQRDVQRDVPRSLAPIASAPSVTLADRILAHVRARPGVTPAELFSALGVDQATVIAVLTPMITKERRVRLTDDNRLFLST